MLKLCVCGNFHCPFCYNQIPNIPSKCPVCKRYIKGDELDNLGDPIDLFELLDEENDN